MRIVVLLVFVLAFVGCTKEEHQKNILSKHPTAQFEDIMAENVRGDFIYYTDDALYFVEWGRGNTPDRLVFKRTSKVVDQKPSFVNAFSLDKIVDVLIGYHGTRFNYKTVLRDTSYYHDFRLIYVLDEDKNVWFYKFFDDGEVDERSLVLTFEEPDPDDIDFTQE